jgi:hypothetical protein
MIVCVLSMHSTPHIHTAYIHLLTVSTRVPTGKKGELLVLVEEDSSVVSVTTARSKDNALGSAGDDDGSNDVNGISSAELLLLR